MKIAISSICLLVFITPFIQTNSCHCRSILVSSIQEDYNVGDEVKFEHLGDEIVGTVIGFTGTGWLRVEFTGQFGRDDTILPPGDVLERMGTASDGKSNDSVPSKSQHELRTWTDNRGNKLKARFVEIDGNKVKLEKEDGSTMSVNITDLSIGDIQHATQLSVGDTFGDNGFGDKDFGNNGSADVDAAASGFKTVEFDFSGVKPIPVTVTNWELKGGSKPPARDWNGGQSFSMELEASHSGGVLIDPRVPSRGFAFGTNIGEAPQGFLFDSKSGKSVGPITFPTPKSSVLAYDAVRHRILTFTEWTRENRTIDVWNLTRDGVEHQFSFSPYPPETKVKLPPGEARFVDDDRIAVVFFHQLAFYDLTNRKSLFGVQFDRMTRPAFGLDGKHAYGLVDKHVVAIELQSATAVARSPVTMMTTSSKYKHPTQLFSISPDLSKLVTVRRRFMETYELSTGKLLDSFFLPTVRELQPYFLDDDNIFVTNIMGGSLVNLRLKSAIWNYSFCKFTFGPLGSQEIWSSTNSGTGSNEGWSGKFSAAAVTIPNDESKQIISSLKLDDLVVLKPGDSVALKLSAAGAGQTAITDQLLAKGFKIDPNSPNVLKATVTKGRSQSREFRDTSSPTGSQKATFSSEYFELELLQRGEVVWYIKGGSSSKDLGDLVILNEGETVQSKANEGRINGGQFFSSLLMPDLFVKIPEKGFYGFTKGDQ